MSEKIHILKDTQTGVEVHFRAVTPQGVKITVQDRAGEINLPARELIYLLGEVEKDLQGLRDSS